MLVHEVLYQVLSPKIHGRRDENIQLSPLPLRCQQGWRLVPAPVPQFPTVDCEKVCVSQVSGGRRAGLLPDMWAWGSWVGAALAPAGSPSTPSTLCALVRPADRASPDQSPAPHTGRTVMTQNVSMNNIS